jgi:ATP-dependent DNA helicase RecQ
MLSAFPAGMPILGCTATANNRVIEDAREQLGQGAIIQRGPLARYGLALHVVDLSEPADRLAWLATHIEDLPGSGIIYCLTKRDVESVSMWLTRQGISTRHYHGALDSTEREALEQMLSDGSLKVIVATSALGMGYDNPRIAFVVHYQSPGSVVHYYQQVGRAGRALETSVGVLLRGVEDRDIIEWFIATAFPSEDQVVAVLAALESSDGPLWTVRIEEHVNLPLGRIEHVLKQLDVEGVVRRVSAQRYERTLKAWTYPRERIEALATIRRSEQTEMENYATGSGCRMAFLVDALDDHGYTTCGLCDNCTGSSFASALSPVLVLDAQRFLDHQFGIIEPRKQDSRRQTIPENERLEIGKYLSRWGDVGHGQAVRRGKQETGRFEESLVIAVAEMIREWNPTPIPTAVTFVPSLNHPALVTDVATRIAMKLGLPVLDLVERIRPGNPQKTMQNSSHQSANVESAFVINLDQLAHIELEPVILIDDVVDSRWTMTEIGRLLRRSGFPNVFPVALATSAS